MNTEICFERHEEFSIKLLKKFSQELSGELSVLDSVRDSA
jgi:hypothetical protein